MEIFLLKYVALSIVDLLKGRYNCKKSKFPRKAGVKCKLLKFLYHFETCFFQTSKVKSSSLLNPGSHTMRIVCLNSMKGFEKNILERSEIFLKHIFCLVY